MQKVDGYLATDGVFFESKTECGNYEFIRYVKLQLHRLSGNCQEVAKVVGSEFEITEIRREDGKAG